MKLYIFAVCMVLSVSGQMFGQERFGVSVGLGLNTNLVNLNDRILDIAQFQEVNGKPGFTGFLQSKMKLSEKINLNSRVSFFTNELEYSFMDLRTPDEAFQDFSEWDLSNVIKEKGISISPGISYNLVQNFYIESYLSYTRIFSSTSDVNYTTDIGAFDVESSETFDTDYSLYSTILKFALDVKKITFSLGAEVFFTQREVFFPMDFKQPKGQEFKVMFGVAYNI